MFAKLVAVLALSSLAACVQAAGAPSSVGTGEAVTPVEEPEGSL